MEPDEKTESTARSPVTILRDVVSRRFEVDTRSLAALRIALGCTLLVDLIHRAGHIELFYTDSGVYPLVAYEATYSQFTGVSLHALSGALWYQQLLFVVAGLFAVAFVLGYRTRLVGVISLIFLFSLQARNPAVLNGGDRLLRVVLFVALVTPLGERYSIDALRRGSAREHVRSFGTAAVLVQPLIVFTANAILKHDGETWYAGDALEIAMANDVMTILLGNVIVDYPTLLTVFTYGWVILLSGSVVLLLLPVGWPRTIAALAYIGAFCGMIVMMTVGIFPLALIAAVLPYLSSEFWDALERRIPRDLAERRPARASLGPLSRPPLEHRALESLRARNESAVSYFLAYCQSLLTVIGLLVLVWMLLFSASTVSGHDVPDGIDYQHLDQQRWSLYAPDPGDSYNWYVTEAELANGEKVAAFGDGEADFDRPPDAADTYETFRHRKFMQAVRRSAVDEPGIIATSYADWACREAAATHDAPVEEVTLYRMFQPSPIDGDYEEPKRLIAIRQECSA